MKHLKLLFKFFTLFLLIGAISFNSFASSQHNGDEKTILLTPEMQMFLLKQAGLSLEGDEEEKSFDEDFIEEDFSKSIYEIRVYLKSNNYKNPWLPPHIQGQATGSGFHIMHNAQHYILTNAHVIEDYHRVYVNRYDKSHKSFPAEVLYYNDQSDLALLRITKSEEEFYQGSTPLEFEKKLPKKGSPVVVMGYPSGGSTSSFTEGVVSRAEHSSYAHSGEDLFQLQISAAVNGGNSGGPVLDENMKVIGIAFQGSEEMQNTNFVIPYIVIEHFLVEAFENGEIKGHPILGIETQNLKNEYQRKQFGLLNNEQGILVVQIDDVSPAKGYLEEGDVILSVDDFELNSEGMFILEGLYPVPYIHLIDMKYVGDEVDFLIKREGKYKNISFSLDKTRDDLDIYSKSNIERPEYYIFGGFVFTPLHKEDMKSQDGLEKINTLLLLGNRKKKSCEESIVKIATVLPEEVNHGYESVATGSFVKTLNGTKITNFCQFVSLMDDYKKEKKMNITIKTNDHVRIDLKVEDSLEADKRIQESLRISELEFVQSKK